MEIPIYVFTGFLESGKTSFIKQTLEDRQFNAGEKTLLLLCEEGFEELDERWLKKYNVVVQVIEEQEELTQENMYAWNRMYRPDRVFLEYNGMWLVKDLFELDLPVQDLKHRDSWVIVQTINMVNAKTFNMYVQNMRSLVFEHASKADMVLFNRCNENMNFSAMRSTIKAINGMAQIAYEDENNEYLEPKMELPYDVTADFIDVEPHNYGIFCMDLMDHPEKYFGKKIHIQGEIIGKDRIIKDAFVLGRRALVCCEEDTSLVGLIAMSELTSQLLPEEWVDLTGKILRTFDKEMNQDMGVLKVEELKVIPPYDNPYVTFD